MTRRTFVAGVMAVFAVPFVAEAQPATAKIPRIGYPVPGSGDCPPSAFVEAFLSGLRDRGYLPGRTIIVDRRCYATGDEQRKILMELVDGNVDVVLVGQSEGVVAASRATRTIPIVGFHADPLATGVASSLARPRGNVTGISSMGLDLVAKRIELLKEIVPTLSGVAVLRSPPQAGQVATWREVEGAAARLGVRLRFVEVRTGGDLERALAVLTRSRPGAVVALTGNAELWVRRQRLFDWALKERVPTALVDATHVREGALLSYGTDLVEVFYQLASYVDKIVKGAKPGDLPIEQATKFRLVINMKTAKALGVTIPPSVLLRADEVIE